MYRFELNTKEMKCFWTEVEGGKLHKKVRGEISKLRISRTIKDGERFYAYTDSKDVKCFYGKLRDYLSEKYHKGIVDDVIIHKVAHIMKNSNPECKGIANALMINCFHVID